MLLAAVLVVAQVLQTLLTLQTMTNGLTLPITVVQAVAVVTLTMRPLKPPMPLLQ
jgi:hypothetical protein